MNKHYESQELSMYLYNGNRWARKLIQVIWSTMLELWKIRNSVIHNATQQFTDIHQREQLELKIRQCYTWSNILSARERNTWFSATLEDKLQEEPEKLRNWLQGVSRLIKIARREQVQRPKESTIMERFLNITHQSETYTRRENIAIMNPQAFQQELNPD
jgi:hypothetical protein